MYRLNFLLFILCAILSGCSNDEYVLTKAEVHGITYNYAEHVYLHAMFLAHINNWLADNNQEYSEKSDRLRSYINGFESGNKRRSIYDSVRNIVSYRLSQSYSEKTINNIKKAHARLNIISYKTSEYLTQERDIESRELTELGKLINQVESLLYPKSDDRAELNLYNLILYQEDITEAHNEKKIEKYFDDLDSAMYQLTEFLNEGTQP
ncbi:hypothetical protein LOK74_19885 [Brevibacillus humidisoli]|uniref:hypothetical protein n=1 Tax=Brevibacillus humidisoli TaxID=2895522 RepID=UPI001E611D26|nr:hypothetical protein [Brevibacillus humidisoli]UFJ40269.1 hypothetical protein LOK74_19885 [Brevibacillus humidisoli]